MQPKLLLQNFKTNSNTFRNLSIFRVPKLFCSPHVSLLNKPFDHPSHSIGETKLFSSHSNQGFKSPASSHSNSSGKVGKVEASRELVERLNKACDVNNIDLFASILKSNASLNRPEQIPEALVTYLNDQFIGRLSEPRSISMILYSTGKCGLKAENEKHRQIIQNLLHRAMEIPGDFSPTQSSMIFSGLKNAHFSYKHLSKEQWDVVLPRLLSVLTMADGRGISDILNSLLHIELKWSDLSVTLQESFLNNIEEIEAKLQPQDRSMIVFSLGRLGLNIDGLSETQQFIIYRIAAEVFEINMSVVVPIVTTDGDGNTTTEAKTVNSTQTSPTEFFSSKQSLQTWNTMYGLAAMNARYEMLPDWLQFALQHTIDNNLHRFRDVEHMLLTLHSFSKLHPKWQDLPQSTSDSICGVLEKNLEKLPQRKVADALRSLSNIGLKLEFLPTQLRQEIQKVLTHILPALSPTELPQLLLALSSLSPTKQDLPYALHESLLRSVQRKLFQLDAQGFSDILFALSHFHVHWQKVRPDLKNLVVDRVVRMFTPVNTTSVSGGFESPVSVSSTNVNVNTDTNAAALTAAELLAPPVVKLSATARMLAETAAQNAAQVKANGAQYISSIIHFFAKSNVQWSSLSESVQFALITGISTSAHSLDNLNLLRVVSGLCKMNAPVDNVLRQYLLPIVLQALQLESSCIELNSNGIARLLRFCTEMCVSWSDLTPEAKDNIENVLLNSGLDTSPVSTVHLLESLCNMHVLWSVDLTPRLCNLLENSIIRHSAEFKPAEVVNVFNSLAALGVHWSELSKTSHKELQLMMANILQDIKSEVLPELLQALVLLSQPPEEQQQGRQVAASTNLTRIHESVAQHIRQHVSLRESDLKQMSQQHVQSWLLYLEFLQVSKVTPVKLTTLHARVAKVYSESAHSAVAITKATKRLPNTNTQTQTQARVQSALQKYLNTRVDNDGGDKEDSV